MVAIRSDEIKSSSFLQGKIIILAEAKDLISQALNTKLLALGAKVNLCSTNDDLVYACEHLDPDLLLLGSLPKSNSLDLYRKCHEIWSDLPIVLMADKPIINDHFRDWSMRQGVKEVVSSHPKNFAQLELVVKNILFPIIEPKSFGKESRKKSNVIPLKPRLQKKSKDTFYQISHQEMMMVLNELSQYSKTYFGDLAIGNYWRKTQKILQPNYPNLGIWQVDHWGKFSASNCDASDEVETFLTIEELDALQVWVSAFTAECERIVTDFGKFINKHALESARLQHLL